MKTKSLRKLWLKPVSVKARQLPQLRSLSNQLLRRPRLKSTRRSVSLIKRRSRRRRPRLPLLLVKLRKSRRKKRR